MQKSIKTALFKKKIFNLNILNDFFIKLSPLKFIHKQRLYKKDRLKGFTEKWMDSNTTTDIDGPLY